ncbi:unnamed protein product [Malus baccata var. baccata]
MAEERSTGKVRWFNDVKGYGFITPDAGGEDLFVHQSSIRSDGFRTVAEGESVEFLIDFGDDGKTKAIDVTGPDGAPLIGNKKESFGHSGGRGGGGGGSGFSGGWRGGDRRNGGGSGGDGCYSCGEPGHMARDCRQGSGGGGAAGGGCFTCGGYGHVARACPNGSIGGGGGGGGGGCYKCGAFGHLARDCATGGGSGGAGACYSCGAYGHMARDCSSGGGDGGARGGGRYGFSSGSGALLRLMITTAETYCMHCLVLIFGNPVTNVDTRLSRIEAAL